MVFFPADLEEGELEQMLRHCRALSLKVSVLPRLADVLGPAVEIDDVEGVTVLGVNPPWLPRSSRAIKRAMDILIAAPLLILVSPSCVLAIAIKLDSRGPVFFAQERVGRGSRHFRLFKLRTMAVDAEQRRAELIAQSTDPDWLKLDHDPRVTRVGRWLRRLSLDELPQLWNVVRGEMSLVGPRPLIPAEDEHVQGWARGRLDLTPGITGYWQVLGRTRIPFEEMVKLDYLYVMNWSLWEDVRLMLRTVPVMVGGPGANYERCEWEFHERQWPAPGAPGLDGGGEARRVRRCPSEDTNFEQLFLMLRRRWRLIVVCVVLVAAAAHRLLAASAQRVHRVRLAPVPQHAVRPGAVRLKLHAPAPSIPLAMQPRTSTWSRCQRSQLGQAPRSTSRRLWFGPRSASRVSARRMSHRSAPRIRVRFVPLRSRTPTSSSTCSSASRPTARRSPARRSLVQKELAALPPAQRYGSVGQSLQNRANQLGVLAALQTGNAEVVQPASVPRSPSSPRTKRNGILGGLLGLLLGLGLVFLAERLDRRVRDAVRARGGVRRSGTRSGTGECVLLERQARSRFPPSRPRRSRCCVPGCDTSTSIVTSGPCS